MLILNNCFSNFNELTEIANNEGFVLLVNKPITWSSFDVVNKLRFATKIKKVGHAGTLDPLATGLMLIAFGKATKKIDSLVLLNKKYKAIFKLGATTKSDDSEYPEENIKNASNIDQLLIKNTINSNFIGKITQMPPNFSAKKIKGKRAYKIAREGKEVELAPVELTINQFEIINYDNPFVEVLIDCSKGTYIRSLARDLGEKLHCGAYMSNLVRTEIGEYRLDDAFELNDFIDKLKLIE